MIRNTVIATGLPQLAPTQDKKRHAHQAPASSLSRTYLPPLPSNSTPRNPPSHGCFGAMTDTHSVSTDFDYTTDDVTKVPLKIAVYSAQRYVKDFLSRPLKTNFTEVHFFEPRLDHDTAILADGFDAVCLFVNDDADERVLTRLAKGGVKTIAMRCAGYDRVDLDVAEKLGICVVRVPTYSPRSVAEMALTMMMASARCILPAVRKVSVGNYTLSGLVGMEVSGKTYGIIGTGNIGIELIKLLSSFQGRILAYDIYPSEQAIAAGAEYVDLETLLQESDIVSLHIPLLPSTKHLMNRERLRMMKQNAMLINVSRGALIDTEALVEVLQTGHLSSVSLDVYEFEERLFFEDFTGLPAQERMRAWDAKWKVLESLPQVLVTPHVAFLTKEALENIAETTVENLRAVAIGEALVNQVKSPAGNK